MTKEMEMLKEALPELEGVSLLENGKFRGCDMHYLKSAYKKKFCNVCTSSSYHGTVNDKAQFIALNDALLPCIELDHIPGG